MPNPHRACRVAALVLACLVTASLSINLGTNDLVAGDEGYYGTMARNIQSAGKYLVNPSLSPHGPPGDKPFLYPLILAGAMELGGVGEIPLRLTTLLLAALAAVFLYRISAEFDRSDAGLWAVVLVFCTPQLAYAGRRVAAEVPLVTFALAGVWLCLRSCRRRSWWGGLLAGGCFGLGFLCKLWLVVPPMVAAAVGCLLRDRGSGGGSAPNREVPWLILGLAACGFVVVGSLHLVLCWWFTPETLGHWVRVYFGFSLAERVGGEGFADYWHRPWGFYGQSIGHAAGLWLPLLSLGFVSLGWSHESKRRDRSLALTLLVWLLPLIPMSAISVKSGGYLQVFYPAMFLLGGLGVEDLRRRLSCGTFDRRPVLGAALLAAVLCAGAQISFTRGFLHPTIHSRIPAAIQALWVVGLAWLGLGGGRRPHWARAAMGVCLAVTLTAGLVRDLQIVRSQDHVTDYRRVAGCLASALRDVDPAQPCFFAPEWPSLSFYTFRSGRYWHSPYDAAAPEKVRNALRSEQPWFFVVGVPGLELYGGEPDATSRAAIESEGCVIAVGADGLPLKAVVYGNEAVGRHR